MTTIQEIREQGIGSNFSVLNPADGFRQDNTLWFGTCSECGERVSQSLHHDYWSHTIYTEKGYFSKDSWERGVYHNYATSKSSDYCPTAKGEVVPCVVWYYEGQGDAQTKVFVS